jgi:hypothetical protein
MGFQEVGLGKVQCQHKLTVRDDNLRVGQAAAQILGKKIDPRKQMLALEIGYDLTKQPAGGLGFAGNTEFGNQAGVRRIGIGGRQP